MTSERTEIFREKTIKRISSPDQLKDYLKVTNPGIWAVLAAVVLLLAGILVWASVGTLETKAEVKVVVDGNTAQVVSVGADALREGMKLRVGGQEYVLSSADADEYGRPVGTAAVSMPDGVYDGVVVTESVRPIEFLLTSR